jgi:hypothetical protein
MQLMRIIRGVFIAATVIAIPFAAPGPALAAWPQFGRALCLAPGLQGGQTITSDGAGGGIVAWQDRRTLPANVFAQHVLADGELDAAWPVDGRAMMTAPTSIPSLPEGSESPAIVPDGAGGAIVTWPDGRSDLNGLDIFAQHVLASGLIDPAWPANAATVCATTGAQQSPVILSDGAGGAIIAWIDGRSGGTVTDLDIFAQHVLASGLVDPAWPANGTAVCTAAKTQATLGIISDGAGGALISYTDGRSTVSGVDIYAHHLLSSGVVDPAWPVNGRALCTAPGTQALSRIVTDGANGGIVTWHDPRDGVNHIYAQRVLNTGGIAPGWPANGLPVSTSGTDEVEADPVSDGAGGAVVAWGDARNGFHNVRAQHVLPAGVVDPAWPAQGTALSFALSEENFPAIVSDGAGGGIVTWRVSFDIFAHHILASGALDPAYPVNGRAVCNLPDLQQEPAIVATGPGGAIVTWRDRRDGISFDIYAKQVDETGTVGAGNPPSVREITFAPPSPSPATGPVTLRFALPRDAVATLGIYDALGRRVRALARGDQSAGVHALTWDLRNESGNAANAGIYFARLEVEGHVLTHKLAKPR